MHRYIFFLKTCSLLPPTDTEPEPEPYTCKDNEWSCGDGYCIQRQYVCDGEIDCQNGADEEANCRKSLDAFDFVGIISRKAAASIKKSHLCYRYLVFLKVY